MALEGFVADMVNHPAHYTSHPKGIEAIDVIEEADRPNLANTIKYVWRVLWGSKGRDLEDLRKARWYLDREIGRMERATLPAGIVTTKGPLTQPQVDAIVEDFHAARRHPPQPITEAEAGFVRVAPAEPAGGLLGRIWALLGSNV